MVLESFENNYMKWSHACAFGNILESYENSKIARQMWYLIFGGIGTLEVPKFSQFDIAPH
jgi:hypothetical protein